ncbi:hypothetical protein QBC39DRAFT_352715 [Podospora conica]|nr:hypothetical protein QBC39DRAFT_352715 [Schizothecium conicum]
MPEPNNPQPAPAQNTCLPPELRDDPDQIELTAILRSLKLDPHGVICPGQDGVLRSLTADRDVIDAVGLRPALIKAMQALVPPEARVVDETVDGTKVPREQWFNIDKRLLPPTLAEQQRQRQRFMVGRDVHQEEPGAEEARDGGGGKVVGA